MHRFFIISVFLLSIVLMVYGDEGESKMIISLEVRNNKGNMITIYDGSPIGSVLEALKKAQPMDILDAERAISPEGRYYLEIIEGEDIQKYKIQNNYWIYDEINNKVLRCELEEPLRDMLLWYIIDNNLLFQ